MFLALTTAGGEDAASTAGQEAGATFRGTKDIMRSWGLILCKGNSNQSALFSGEMGVSIGPWETGATTPSLPKSRGPGSGRRDCAEPRKQAGSGQISDELRDRSKLC
jgi:hypothetical protein